MNELVLPLGIALGLPLLLAAMLAFVRPHSRLDWLLFALLCGGITAYLSLASPIWAWIGFGWRIPAPVAVIAAALWSARRLRGRRGWPAPRLLPLVGTALRGAMVTLFAVMLIELQMGRARPDGTVDLSFPFKEGRFVVLHGGGATSLNYHRVVPAQAWATDLVALDERGRRARGVRPEALEAYEIFDQAVIAPCDGVVSGMSDGAPDTPVGGSDSVAPAGNHVLLSCVVGEAEITLLLAHLRSGSMAVTRGDRIRRGALLGRVGSSGNSTEPHLHIHAVRGREAPLDTVLASAEAVPLSFGGRFLTRNTIIRLPDPP